VPVRRRAGQRRHRAAPCAEEERPAAARHRARGPRRGTTEMAIGLSHYLDRRRHPPRPRLPGHLPEPEERHRHPDVGGADPALGEPELRRLLRRPSATWRGRSSPCSCSPSPRRRRRSAWPSW
jgi:hypothetical protein